MLHNNFCTIRITDECEINCPVCSTTPPQKAEKMSRTEILGCVAQVAQLSSLWAIHFAGGEPFLLFDDLVEAIRTTNSRGLKTIITTQAFWARSPGEARERIEALSEAGLTCLLIHTDRFHQPHVPLARIVNVVTAARAAGTLVYLFSTIGRGEETPGTILRRLAEEFVGLGIITRPLLPVGRAKKEVLTAEDLLTTSEVPTVPCPDPIPRRLTVDVDGSVYPCFSPAGRTPPLRMGNLHQRPILEIVTYPDSALLLAILREHGPSWFLPALADAGIVLPGQNGSGYVNVCHLCYEIFSDPEAAKVAHKAAVEPCLL
jgi:MoaA/NifB/PqqE/SkfB family radical SAM enzyme